MADDHPQNAHSIQFWWCRGCNKVHVGLFDETDEPFGIGSVDDVDQLISMLHEAKTRKEWALKSEPAKPMQ